ncbi:MAG: phage tail spike protein, partial [Paraclostridium sp.]
MLFLFNRNDKFIKTKEATSALYKRSFSEWTLEIECPLTTDLVKGNKVAIKDKDEVLRYFVISDILDDYDEETTTLKCDVEYITLANTTIEDKRVVQGSAAAAVTKLLEGTDFKVGTIEPQGIENINFYFVDRYNGLIDILKTYGGELDYRVELGKGNSIQAKILDIKHSIGEETGLRCTYDTNLVSLKRKIHHEGHFTVLYGRGSSIETEGGGNSRLLTFDGVTWVTPTNPLNKPKDDKFLEHPGAIEKWGRIEGQYQNDKIDNKEALLNETYKALLDTIEPKITYETTIEDIQNIENFEHYKYKFGDTIYILNEDKDLTIAARITSEEYDIVDTQDINVTLGDTWEALTDKTDNDTDDLKDYVDNIIEDLDFDVDDTKFPNTLPDAPRLAGRGGLDSISVSWTYESKNYYTYELYASKTKDFAPNSSNLIFEGQASLHIHDCKPKETWYFRARAKNTHGNYTAFSNQLTVDTTKISDGAVWIEEAAIGDLLLGTLRLDRGWIGKLSADLLDVKGKLTVTDGNGHVTFEVDSFGRIHMDVSSLSIQSKDIIGELAINMVPNSNFATDNKVQGWHFWQSDYNLNGCSWYKDQHGGFPKGEGLGISSDLNQACTATSEQIFVEYGEHYTLSIDKLYVEQNVINSKVMIRWLSQSNEIIKEDYWHYAPGEYNDITHTLQITDERIKKVNVLIWNDGATVENKQYVVVFFNRIQFQKGKTRTPWKLATTDSIIQNIADMRVDAEGIRNTVATIEGDYVTGTQFTQTNNQFRYEFLNSGADNELWNSDLSQGQRGWTLQGGDRVIIETNVGYSGGGIPVNSGIRIGDCTDANAHAYQVVKPKKANAYKYRVGCWVQMDNVNNTHGTGSSMADIYFQIRYKDGSHGWPSFDLRNFVGNHSGWTWVDFDLHLEGKPVEHIEFFVYKRNTTGTLRVTQIYFREGDIPSNKWKAHPGEVYSNTTTIDGQG